MAKVDTDLEMVDQTKNDDVISGEELEGADPVNDPAPKRSASCYFLVVMFVSILGFASYVVARLYLSADEVHLGGGFQGDVGLDDKQKDKLSEAVDRYQDRAHGKGWTKHHPGTDVAEKNWLEQTVKLDDGKMYQIRRIMEHDSKAFTEGLMFAEGRLFESIGLNGKSELRELDPKTGKKTSTVAVMDSKFFGEGLTYADGKLIQLTYKKRTGFVFDLNNLEAPPTNFTFQTTTGEGWGMTYDPERHELIVSDGSAYLHFWDPETMTQIRKVQVNRMNGRPAKLINELEYWRHRVIANVWFQDILIVINPETGVVEKEYDFSQLYPKDERRRVGADVLNGISVSANPDELYVTGKNWNRMFLVSLS